MLNDILTLDQLQWLLYWSDCLPNLWPKYRAWPSPNYEWFPWSILNGCGIPARNAYPYDRWFCPIFGTCVSSNFYRPVFPNLPCLFSTFHLEYPSVSSRFCIYQKYIQWHPHRTSCAPPIWKRALARWLQESRLTIRGDRKYSISMFHNFKRIRRVLWQNR